MHQVKGHICLLLKVNARLPVQAILLLNRGPRHDLVAKGLLQDEFALRPIAHAKRPLSKIGLLHPALSDMVR